MVPREDFGGAAESDMIRTWKRRKRMGPRKDIPISQRPLTLDRQPPCPIGRSRASAHPIVLLPSPKDAFRAIKKRIMGNKNFHEVMLALTVSALSVRVSMAGLGSTGDGLPWAPQDSQPPQSSSSKGWGGKVCGQSVVLSTLLADMSGKKGHLEKSSLHPTGMGIRCPEAHIPPEPVMESLGHRACQVTEVQ